MKHLKLIIASLLIISSVQTPARATVGPTGTATTWVVAGVLVGAGIIVGTITIQLNRSDAKKEDVIAARNLHVDAANYLANHTKTLLLNEYIQKTQEAYANSIKSSDATAIVTPLSESDIVAEISAQTSFAS